MVWLNHNSGAVTAILTLVLAVITAVYVYLTKKSVKELEIQRMNAALPIVVAKFLNSKNEEYIDKDSHLVFQNCGQGIALSIKYRMSIVWEDDIIKGDERSITALIPSDSFHIDLTLGTMSSIGKSLNYKGINIVIEYQDIYNRNFTTVQGFSDDISTVLTINGKELMNSIEQNISNNREI